MRGKEEERDLAVIARYDTFASVLRSAQVTVACILAASDTEPVDVRFDKVDKVRVAIAGVANFILCMQFCKWGSCKQTRGKMKTNLVVILSTAIRSLELVLCAINTTSYLSVIGCLEVMGRDNEAIGELSGALSQSSVRAKRLGITLSFSNGHSRFLG